MIKTFLKAKHWQLFLLTFGIPMIFQIIMMGTMISGISSGNEPDVEVMFNYFKIFPIIMILFMGVFFGWFWSVAIGLDEKIPEPLKLNTGRFKLFFFFPIVYILGISVFMFFMFSNLAGVATITGVGSVVPIIFLLHLFSMFCMFYCLYFVAKTIKTAETQKKVTFGDFAGEFFLIWFFPIGVWIVQPKINKMIEGDLDYNESILDA